MSNPFVTRLDEVSGRLILAGFCAVLLATALKAQSTVRVSDGFLGQGNQDSYSGAVSGDGLYVAFASDASNLVPGDTNGATDIFVHDVAAGTVVRVSVGAFGQARADCEHPSISEDGRYVAFHSGADNLVAGDTNDRVDVFRKDLWTGALIRVNVDVLGAQAVGGDSAMASIDSGGDFVAFQSAATNLVAPPTVTQHVYVKQISTGRVYLASVDSTTLIRGNAPSYRPSISADGTHVAFESDANNLAPDTNGLRDIFVHGFTGTTFTTLASTSSLGQANQDCFRPSLSKSGKMVAFDTAANSLITYDTNGLPDVYVRDLNMPDCARVSEDPLGADGNGASYSAAISHDGHYLAFESAANNFGPPDLNGVNDIYIRHMPSHWILLTSVSGTGVQANQPCHAPTVSATAGRIAFHSLSDTLDAPDLNLRVDVFLREWGPPSWINYGVGHPGTLGIPSLTLDTDPVLGSLRTLLVGNSLGANTTGFLLLGFAPAAIPTVLDGTINLIVARTFMLAIPAAGLGLPMAIPDDPYLCGVSLYLQTLQRDSGASKGVAFSQGLQLIFGR
ncbi:MAG: hypothetical protein AB1486_16050 [Planctomycetota bacterium]